MQREQSPLSYATRRRWHETDNRKTPSKYPHGQNLAIDAYIAQLVERILGKDEVFGPIPNVGSIYSLKRHGRAAGKWFIHAFRL